MQVRGKVFYRSEDDKSPGLQLSVERQMSGDGDIDYLCGGCDAVMGAHLGKPFFTGNAPIRCPICRAWNAMPDLPE